MTTLRQEAVTGFILHQRPYRENSRLVNLLTLERGRVDGVARKLNIPLYQPFTALISGRTTLRSLSQPEACGMPLALTGDGLLAGFYINELLIRLLPLEEPMPEVCEAYGQLLLILSQPQNLRNTNWIDALRRFENGLLAELGYAIDWQTDRLEQPIQATTHYVYRPGEGFEAHTQGELGSVLLTYGRKLADPDPLSDAQRQMATRVQKLAINHLLGDKPLKSRELWRQRSAVTR